MLLTCKTQAVRLPLKNINKRKATMKTAREAVNHFYDVCNNRQGEGMGGLLAENIMFQGPIMQLSGADQYIAAVSPLLKFHKGMRMLKQFEDGDHVCSIYEMTLGTPAGGTLTLAFADWIRITEGKVAEQKLYYDPREFARAFGI
jgi:ketosteroid isomerase-like protein